MNEPEENLLSYQELDLLYRFIEDHPEKDKFKEALSPDRLCIAIPYYLFQDKRLPHDDRTEDGQYIIFASPGLDRYRSILLDQMTLTAGTNAFANFGSVEVFNKWKLLRLARKLELGWEKFAEAYLAPLHDKQKYVSSFMAAK